MTHMRATTKAHYEHYCKEVKRWCKVLGVSGWQIYFEHSDLEDSFGWVAHSYRDGAATFIFPVAWNVLHKPLNKQSISWTALHEVLHLLLSPLGTVAEDRFTTAQEIHTIVEHAVTKLEVAITSLERG